MALTPDQMKAKMVRLYDELNKVNLDILEEVFAPDFVNHGGAGLKDLGRQEFKDFYVNFLEAMPDMRLDSTFMVAENDIVFVRGTLGGTH